MWPYKGIYKNLTSKDLNQQKNRLWKLEYDAELKIPFQKFYCTVLLIMEKFVKKYKQTPQNVLGCKPDETCLSTIKKLYIKKALKLHPDKSKGKSLEFIKIDDAYKTIVFTLKNEKNEKNEKSHFNYNPFFKPKKEGTVEIVPIEQAKKKYES